VTTRAGQAGVPGERRARRIAGPFVPRLVCMLESPAYRVLSLSARRVLDRIEIELAHHAGRDNGRLAVTYEHFVEYGVRRHSINAALHELSALGFIEVTEQGVAGNAEHRAPNRFRLTYRPDGRTLPTNEWRRIKTMEEAQMAQNEAWSESKSKRRKWRVARIFFSDAFAQSPMPPGVTENGENAALANNFPMPPCVTTSRSLGSTPEPALPALSSLPTAGGPKSARTKRKLPWSTPTLTEITDPAAIEAIRRDAARALADAKCAKCQPDPFVINIGGRPIVTRDLSTMSRLRDVA
jgi:hypothetical protein